MGSLFLELSKQRSLLKMMEERGFTLCQQNGQRTYGGPPPNWGSRPPPSRDCEVFIGRLPRMCFEDELIPLFLTAGELYEFRLMLDFSGTNRGYGYAHYATPAGAAKAIKTLNKYEIRPGHQIGVLKSKNNCRLLFGNIGSALKVETFNEFIRTATDQVLNVFMFKNFQQLKETDFSISSEVEEAFLGRMPRNNEENQYAVVEYENHKAAAVARRVLIPKYGHILAIDWAVPPRERKRFGFNNEIQKPLNDFCNSSSSTTIIKDSEILSSTKEASKIRPVPILMVQPSPLDNVPFMPKMFYMVVKFLKYQLSVCLYKSVDQLEIPLFICKEIERKIVDRITNLENCSQAVQLIFNYFSWYNEKKRFVINTEVQKLMQEVKMYAELFVNFVNRKITYGPSPNPGEDNYFINSLPLQLNVLFRIILISNSEHQIRLSSGITKGLNWVIGIMQKGDKASKDFIEEIIHVISEQDPDSVDKASNMAKSAFLNNITSNVKPKSFHNSAIPSFPVQDNKNLRCIGNDGSLIGIDSSPPLTEIVYGLTNNSENRDKKMWPQLNQQGAKVDDDSGLVIPFSELKTFEPKSHFESNSHPSVPLLLVRQSVNVPLMPNILINVLAYFRHLVSICVNTLISQMNISQEICEEIERKIISRISNMENCKEAVRLILNYFSWWLEKQPWALNSEILNLLKEVKFYADSFVRFARKKSISGNQSNLLLENYFCNVLPLRLNILFQIMLIFNSDNSMRFLIGITKGLAWVEDLIQNGDRTAKEFMGELTHFILESDPASLEKAKNLGKVLCTEMIISGALPFSSLRVDFPFNVKGRNLDKNNLPKSTTSKVSTCGSIVSSFCTISDTTEGSSEYEP